MRQGEEHHVVPGQHLRLGRGENAVGEWPEVRLAPDFPTLPELDASDPDGVPWLTPEERDQELHLLYVAATRARRRLEPNDAVRSCLAAPPGPAVADRERAA